MVARYFAMTGSYCRRCPDLKTEVPCGGTPIGADQSSRPVYRKITYNLLESVLGILQVVAEKIAPFSALGCGTAALLSGGP